jgi:hypothetical protein
MVAFKAIPAASEEMTAVLQLLDGFVMVISGQVNERCNF